MTADDLKATYETLKNRAIQTYENGRDRDRDTAVMEILAALLETRREAQHELFAKVDTALAPLTRPPAPVPES